MRVRVRAVLQYDGTSYRGWQRQADASTIQAACEEALEGIVGKTAVVAAGRTDTGVHARGQVVHFDHGGRMSTRDLRRAWNAHLPDAIWVVRLARARPDFHARHDAVARTYRYHLALGRVAASPFVRRYAWPIERPLDWEAMNAATAALVGEHDFRRFAKGAVESRTEREPGRCAVRAARWVRSRDGRALEITADRFLRHMVRALVGSIVAVGLGRIGADEVRDALEPGGARPRAAYAPPRGLFLWEVEYEDP
ncbi:MAG TPA: tRNA pseudouridine(38-40) synthase TruA [Gemmatimonadota bacterium]|nr:tRNA pseudouridine(38-40) synthase TruA [Gemmatimonadota bacterium]